MTWAESWEVVDLGEEQSRVLGGPFDGRLLHDLVLERPQELLGRNAACGRFPLLFKFLDAATTLSVQVHPNDSQSAHLSPGSCGKSEAWVILFAEPDSRVFIGLKSAVDRGALERHLTAGTVEECLHSIIVQPGDVISVPAGTVHAIGAGISLAEIQQSNDMTFRLFDWNRRDAQGRSRQLHIEQALQCIDFSCGPGALHLPREIPAVDHRHEVLVQNGHFLWRRHKSMGRIFQLPDEDRCRIVSLIAGQANVQAASGRESLALGESLLIPADCDRVEVEATEGSVLLEALPA